MSKGNTGASSNETLDDSSRAISSARRKKLVRTIRQWKVVIALAIILIVLAVLLLVCESVILSGFIGTMGIIILCVDRKNLKKCNQELG